jgi:ribonuclease R
MSDRYHYNQRRQELVGMRAGQRFRPGDRVTVQVVHIDPATGRLDLELAGNQ